MVRRKDRTTGEKTDSRERKVEMSKRIKHTTWAHGDDAWNVMCARQTYDLSHACACHPMCKTRENVTCEGVLFTPTVGCSRTAVSCERSDYYKKSCKVSLLSSFVKKLHNGFHRSICCSFTSSDVLDLKFYEFHQESFHCHQDVLDEEDDGCHFWNCQEGIRASRSSPDARRRTMQFCSCFVEVWTEFHRVIASRCVERDPPILFLYLKYLSCDIR